MNFGADLVGGFIKVRKDFTKYQLRLKKATKGAAVKTSNGLKNELRAQVKSAGLGSSVANSWRSAAYPKDGESLNSAATVWSKAPHIIAAFDKGTVIKSSKGFWLAIPTENAPSYSGSSKDRRAITPKNFPVSRYGPLRFVYLKGRRLAMLVVDNQRASYSKKTKELRGFKKASATALKKGNGITTVVMFILVPQTNPRKRLDVNAAAQKFHAEFAKNIDRSMGTKETQ